MFTHSESEELHHAQEMHHLKWLTTWNVKKFYWVQLKTSLTKCITYKAGNGIRWTKSENYLLLDFTIMVLAQLGFHFVLNLPWYLALEIYVEQLNHCDFPPRVHTVLHQNWCLKLNSFVYTDLKHMNTYNMHNLSITSNLYLDSSIILPIYL